MQIYSVEIGFWWTTFKKFALGVMWLGCGFFLK